MNDTYFCLFQVVHLYSALVSVSPTYSNKVKALAERLNSLNELNYEFGIIAEKVTVKPVKLTTLLEYVGETETNAE